MRNKDKLRNLLSRGDRGIGHASGIRGVLSKLFHNLLIQTGMNGAKWNYLIGEYAKREVSHQDNRRDLASIRGNLNKEFTRPQMTWKVFCKAMMFLHYRRFKIIIIAEHEDGHTETVETIVEAATVFDQPVQITPRPQVKSESHVE
jgi:hypothetical protein